MAGLKLQTQPTPLQAAAWMPRSTAPRWALPHNTHMAASGAVLAKAGSGRRGSVGAQGCSVRTELPPLGTATTPCTAGSSRQPWPQESRGWNERSGKKQLALLGLHSKKVLKQNAYILICKICYRGKADLISQNIHIPSIFSHGEPAWEGPWPALRLTPSAYSPPAAHFPIPPLLHGLDCGGARLQVDRQPTARPPLLQLYPVTPDSQVNTLQGTLGRCGVLGCRPCPMLCQPSQEDFFQRSPSHL